MTTISISAVGDILMWKRQIDAARMGEDAYSFDYVFEKVSRYLRQSDLALANLETTLSGREAQFVQHQPVRPVPLFNCPDELAPALKSAGFHVTTTANNHCLDRGAEGLKRTLDVLDEHGLKHTGTYRSFEEQQRGLVIDIKGVRVGILAFTYGTNRIPVPQECPWMVDLLHDGSLLPRIRELKQKADLTIVCLHWGREFQPMPTSTQRIRAQACFEHGADIILGCHPHVLQPMEMKRVRDLDGVEKRRFIIYSLGNFTSTMMWSDPKTLNGVIVQLQATKRADGTTEVDGFDYVPTWIKRQGSRGVGEYTVLPIEDALEKEGEELSAEERSALQIALTDTRDRMERGLDRRPTWTPFELATLTAGEWLKAPSWRWDPARVRAPVLNSVGFMDDLRTEWLRDGIVFVRTEAHLNKAFGSKSNPGGSATGCLVIRENLAKSPSLPSDRAVLVIKDFNQAVSALAMHARARMKGKLAMVTGTVGKTTTRGMLVQALGGRENVITTDRNTPPHLYQHMASSPPGEGVAVLECGFGSKLDIFREASQVLRPDVVLLTQLDVAHMDLFGTDPLPRDEALRRIGEQKLQLTEELHTGGAVILNSGMPMYAEFKTRMEAFHRVVSFGESPESDVRLLALEQAGDRTVVSASVFGSPVRFPINVPGRFMALNALAALAAARELGADVAAAAEALGGFTAVAGRARVIKLSLGGERPVTVIDDSYNATPLSMRSCMALLKETAPMAGGRRLAVLGDIAHLGAESADVHAQLAQPLMENGVDRVYAFGPEMIHLHNSLPPEMAAGHFRDRKMLVDALVAELRAGDVVALKASIPSNFPSVVRMLQAAARAAPSQATVAASQPTAPT